MSNKVLKRQQRATIFIPEEMLSMLKKQAAERGLSVSSEVKTILFAYFQGGCNNE